MAHHLFRKPVPTFRDDAQNETAGLSSGRSMPHRVARRKIAKRDQAAIV
jgi:hypothetical protein